MRTVFLVIAAMNLSLLSAVAEETVRIIEPWARATILASRPGAIYLTIESARGDRLLSVESPIADRVVIHTADNNNGIIRMVHLDTLELPPGKPVVLAPGDMHLMLVGLKKRVIQGSWITLILQFEKAGEVTIIVPVLGIGAKGPKEGIK